MRFTLDLFRHWHQHLPPFVPDKTRDKMGAVLNHLEKDLSATIGDVEKIMIAYGYQIWPYQRAFGDVLCAIEVKMGEYYLLPRLSPALQKKYHDFKMYGGTWRDLHSGGPARFFGDRDNLDLSVALIEANNDLRAFAKRLVAGTGKHEYLSKVDRYRETLREIDVMIERLRHLADSESAHTNLSAEILERVRLFEHGLCGLAPSAERDSVAATLEYFVGRKNDLNRLRGINVPMQIDFYSAA